MEAKDIDYVEMYVGDARQTAYFYGTAFGFRRAFHAGPDTGTPDRNSYVLTQGSFHLIVTGAVHADDPVAAYVQRHGDSVREIGFRTSDVRRAHDDAVRAGATSLSLPQTVEDSRGRWTKASVTFFGDTVHAFVERDAAVAPAVGPPGYRPVQTMTPPPMVLFAGLDHLAICVEPDALARTVDFYCNGFGMRVVHEENVVTAESAMNSKVVQSPNGRVCFALMEPAPGRRKSQIEEFLVYHRGPGVQHMALRTEDIATAVRGITAAGVEIMQTPGSFYDELEARVGPLRGEGEVPDLDTVRALGILVDKDDDGYLMQCFTRQLTDRPTFFAEVIERRYARGFGSGNVRALFRAIEREQALRGDL
jgi:4-hydroxyphenylpyruvate dioxygenase